MQDDRPTRSHLSPNPALYRVMRVLAGVMTVIAGMLVSYACIAALFGDTELLMEFIDEDGGVLTMNAPTIIAILATNALALTSLWLLFFSMNRFLRQAARGELLVSSARNALKRLGVGMILLYLTTRMMAVGIPLIGIAGFWADNGIMIPFSFVDLDFLYLLIGVVLLALGQALREGQAAKEEAKQYV